MKQKDIVISTYFENSMCIIELIFSTNDQLQLSKRYTYYVYEGYTFNKYYKHIFAIYNLYILFVQMKFSK